MKKELKYEKRELNKNIKLKKITEDNKILKDIFGKLIQE